MRVFWLRNLQKDIYRFNRPRGLPEHLLLAVIVGLIALLVGCGGGTRDVRVALASTEHLNPNEDGAPLPVQVRVYQLRDKEKFEKASFVALQKRDKEELGDDLVKREDWMIAPEFEKDLPISIDTEKDVDYLGVMGVFLHPEGNSWRKVFSSDVSNMVPFSTPEVQLILDRYSVILEE